MAEVKQITGPVELGEGPYWDEDNQCLLFVDIIKGDVHRYYPATERHQVLHVEKGSAGGSVSFVLPVAAQPALFVVGLGRSMALVEWPLDAPDAHTAPAKCVLHSVDAHTPTNRFNDGKCDPRGRLWAGTMSRENSPGKLELHKGALYSLNNDLSLSTKVDKISLSNGLAWSADRATMYYIDSSDYCVYAFDYDDDTGEVDNRRTVLDYKAAGLGKDIPDGMTLDTSGNIWVANFYGQKVICIDPEAGKIVRQVDVPASNVTSVCWGGADYSTLYVTSSQIDIPEEKLKEDKAQGGVFAVTGLGVKGSPPVAFKVDLQLLKAKMNA